MGIFGKKEYKRGQVLEEAGKLRSKKKWKKAIKLYHEVLEHEGEDPDVEAKLASALAETKNLEEAWPRFRSAGRQYAKRGFVQKAEGVFKQAAVYLPQEIEVWQTLARINLGQSRRADAAKVLMDGREHFRKKKHREEAEQILRQVIEIEPHHFEASLDLAGLLAKKKLKGEATALLEDIVDQPLEKQRRRVRKKLFWLRPNPATLWRYLMAR